MKTWVWGAVGTGICFFILGVNLVLPLFSKEKIPDGLMSDVSSEIGVDGVGAEVNPVVSKWFLVERGDTWNKYRNGSKPEYRIESFGDLINYRNETGIYQEINISHLSSSVDGSYGLSDTPYKFVLDSSRSFFTVYPDRNNLSRYIVLYMPSSFTMNNHPFWQNNPALTSNTGSIQWSSPGYDIRLRCDNSKVYFELILKNSLTAVTSFNMTVIPHNMSIRDVGWLNILTDANGVSKPVVMAYNEFTHDMRLSFNTVGLTYPITVDPSLVVYSSTSDGNIYFEDKKFKAPILAKDIIYTEPQRKVAIVLDTKLVPNCYKIAENADFLVAEAVYLKQEAELADLHEHLTAEQAGDIAKKAGVKKLYLSHLSQRYDGSEKLILNEAKKKFKNVFIAEDLMETEI
jgi:ribonuclease BN (tRNA processing enzyme)